MHTFHAPKLEGEKMDVCIHGIGWFCISGQVKDVYVKVHKGIQVTFRKAMI
jgi:30S ribosome assembly GTPase